MPESSNVGGSVPLSSPLAKTDPGLGGLARAKAPSGLRSEAVCPSAGKMWVSSPEPRGGWDHPGSRTSAPGGLIDRGTVTDVSGVAERHRECVRHIEGPACGTRAEKPQDHGLDLLLFRSTVSSHGLLHRGRCVLGDRDSLSSQDRQENPSRVGQMECRPGVDAVKRGLDGGGGGPKATHQLLKGPVQRVEPVRKRGSRLQADDIALHELWARRRSRDEPPSGSERPWIHAEDAHVSFRAASPSGGPRRGVRTPRFPGPPRPPRGSRRRAGHPHGPREPRGASRTAGLFSRRGEWCSGLP